MRGAHDSWEVTYTGTLEAKDPTVIWALRHFRTLPSDWLNTFVQFLHCMARRIGLWSQNLLIFYRMQYDAAGLQSEPKLWTGLACMSPHIGSVCMAVLIFNFSFWLWAAFWNTSRSLTYFLPSLSQKLQYCRWWANELHHMPGQSVALCFQLLSCHSHKLNSNPAVSQLPHLNLSSFSMR